jgi:hypothetical protein
MKNSEQKTMISALITLLFVAIFVHGSSGQKCRKSGNNFHIEVYDCDIDSYNELSRDFAMEKIVKFDAAYKNNNFRTIDDKMFRNMTNLIELGFYDCKIQSVHEGAFSALKLLTKLDLPENKLRSLHENTFRSLRNLERLSLHNNQLEEIPGKLFENNRNLKELGMSGNNIKDFPEGLFDTLTDLEILSMRNNEVEIIHLNTFKQNQKLKILHLYSNKIHAVADGAFAGLSRLTHLDLRNNSCISKEYGDRQISIDLNQISLDLKKCYKNFNLKKSSILAVILTTISSMLSIGGTIIIINYVFKLKKVLEDERQIVQKRRESFHYYSVLDTPGQIEQVKREQLKQELQLVMLNTVCTE